MNITLKNVQVYPRMSEETTAFNATIYLDGKKVGEVKNQGHGGCNFYHWTDPAKGKEINNWANAQELEFKFEQLDQIIDKLLFKAEDEKWIAKQTKKQTIFLLVGDKADSWRTVKAPYTDKVKEFLVGKYGDKLVVIANENPVKALELMNEIRNSQSKNQ